MSDIQVLIENLRKSVAFPESVTPDQMRDYARQYTEACAELNRRMMQCIQQIRAGNITEGIRLAELKPNLTDMYFSLDFAGREEWNEIVATLGFDIPPSFPVELSKELSEAYMKLSPLEPLLRWHRLHALNGSLIKERLAMIRTIAKADRENIFWAEDQEKFEKARIKELSGEIQQAIETKNFEQIVSLHAELNVTDWIIKPPPDFRWRLAGTVLQNEADMLMEKFSAFEYNEASSIYDRMQQIVALEKMAIPPAIWQLTRPAVQWLNETKRQNALQLASHRAAAELQDALEDDTVELLELERLYDILGTAVSQAEMDIPEELENLYNVVITRRHTSARRNTLLTVFAIISICFLAVCLLVWGGLKGEYNKRVAEVLQGIGEIKEKNSIEDIPDMLRLRKDSPDIARNRKVSDGLVDLEKMFGNDKKRAEDFKQCLTQANDLLNGLVQPGFSNLEPIKNYLNQAENFSARTDQEKNNYRIAKGKFNTIYNGLIEEEFGKPLSKFESQFNEIKGNTNLSPQEALVRLNGITGGLDNMDKRIKNLFPRSEDSPEQVQNRLNSIVISIDLYKAYLETMKSLLSSVSDWTVYRSTLERLATEFPDYHSGGTNIASDANVVLNELNDVQNTVVLLQDFATSYTKAAKDFRTLQQESASLKKKYDDASTRFSGTSNDIFQPGDILEILSKMIPYSPGAFETVELLLRELSQDEVFPFVDDNWWYYLTEQPTAAGSYSYVEIAFGDKKNHQITASQFNRAKIPVITPYAYAKDTQQRIDAIDGDVETIVDTILSRLEDSELDIDPIIQWQMMDSLISDMSRIDPFFASNFKELHRMIIEERGINQLTKWMTVNQMTASRRGAAKTAMERCRQLIQPAIAKTRQERAEFMKETAQFHPRFEWVGVLIKTGEKWDCDVKPGSTNVKLGDLYVLRQKLGQTIEPVKIGQVSSGRVELHDNDPLFLQCAPVFLVQQ